MPVVFPPVETASPEGLLAVGGNLDLETLLTAYKSGIFPWPISEDSPLTWFSPDPRGILFLKDLHISRSFVRFMKKNPYQISFNQNFDKVIQNCSEVKRKHEKGTWISPEIIDGYNMLFQAGYAYSVEVYREKKLVGGLYGVCIGELISGESMFHIEDNASKVAFFSLMEILKKHNIQWIDTQMVTPIISSFGGIQISRNEFIRKIKKINLDSPSREKLFSLT